MSSFWLILKQQWAIAEISIFSNSSHLEWRAKLSDTILKWDPPRDHPCHVRFNLVQRFQRRNLNVKVYDVRRTDGRTDDDGWRTPNDSKSSHGLHGLWPGELITTLKVIFKLYGDLLGPNFLCQTCSGRTEVLEVERLLYLAWMIQNWYRLFHNSCSVKRWRS